jgi:hypothetical protein
VFGRTGSRVSVAAAGKRVRRGSRCAPQGYDVLFKERNGRYISPDEFAGNQRLIADRMGIGAVKGAVRRGELLLAGFLRCGHCGRKLDVLYSGLGRGQTMAGFKRPIVHHLLVAEKIAQLTIQLLLHTLADPKWEVIDAFCSICRIGGGYHCVPACGCARRTWASSCWKRKPQPI